MKILLCVLLFAAAGIAQTAPASGPDAEQEDLRRVVGEGSSSTVDLIRALEGHLTRYPQSSRRHEIDRAITKAAIEIKDERRIAVYGQLVLAQEPNDLPTLDRVTRALLVKADAESFKQALVYSQRFEQLLKEIAGKPAGSEAETAKRKDEIDRAMSRALLSQAIATGNLGDPGAAAALARRALTLAPSAEAAAELGRRLAQTNKAEDAVQAYADAFVLAESASAEEKALIRRRMGELYQKLKGSEAGLGDVVLKAWDRNAAAAVERRNNLRALDPNSGVTNPLEFTLTGIGGEKLALSSLAGKAIVLDFWATWCGPCRAQHPLYEEVKKRFAGRDDVVFLAIATDEDRQVVKPFLEEQGWTARRVYYEDGLSRALRVTSIPTTVVFGRNGSIVSRMNGYDPERFVDMLTERINEALK